MPPDDFVGLVAFDPLRSFVPAGYAPFCVQHKNRVVLHLVHEQAVVFLALAQRRRGAFVFGNVANRAHEELAVRVLQRAEANLDGENAPVLSPAK